MTTLKPAHALAPLALFLVLILLTAGAAAKPSLDGIHKQELGLKRMTAVFPEHGAEIQDTSPMITADFSALETPVDTGTVVMTLNGYDVTGAAEINTLYALYQPEVPLRAGDYEVRITARDANRNLIEPLSWSFRIKGPAATATDRQDRTTGRFSISSDYVDARYQPLSTLDVSQTFREKEGMKLNTDLTFTNASDGRTITGAFHRETQQYTGTGIDTVRLNYVDANVRATAGSAWVHWSDLTILGADLNGVTVTKQTGAGRLQFVSGLTQDPSTSGAFKQMTTGIRAELPTGNRHTTSLSALQAYELDDPVYRRYRLPERDAIFSVMHHYISGRGLEASLELASNIRRQQGAAASRNQAYRLLSSYSGAAYSAEMELYNIDENFMPVSEGSSKYLKSDRKGYRAKGGYNDGKSLFLGGEHENYDADSTGIGVRRGAAFARYTMGDSALNYRVTKLTTSSGTLSRTTSATLDSLLSGANRLAQSRVSAGWFKIDFAAPGILAGTSKYQFALNTSFNDILSLSLSAGAGRTDDRLRNTSFTNRGGALGLNWAIRPVKLNWSGRYEVLTNRGPGADNQETRVMSALRFAVDYTLTLNLTWETISYSDAGAGAYCYEQDVWRAGAEWSF